MRQEYQSHAFLLQAKEFNEHDELFTAFTLEQGKLRLLAKGVRKPGSRLRHSLLVPSEVQIRFVEGSILRIIGAQVLENGFFFTSEEWTRLPWYWATELVVRSTADQAPSRELYGLLKQVWVFCRKSDYSPNFPWLLGCWITLHFLAVYGAAPCLPKNTNNWNIDAGSGGFVSVSGKGDVSVGAASVILTIASSDSNDLMTISNKFNTRDFIAAHYALASLASLLLQRDWRLLKAWAGLEERLV